MFVSSILQKLDMLVALPQCVGMISTPNCVAGHCFGPRLTAGVRIVGPWSTSFEKFREIFVGGRTGKTRFPSFISSFPLRKRKKNREVLLNKTVGHLEVRTTWEKPKEKTQRKDPERGPRSLKTPYYMFQFPIILQKTLKTGRIRSEVEKARQLQSLPSPGIAAF